jgi:hypothetical protein
MAGKTRSRAASMSLVAFSGMRRLYSTENFRITSELREL